MQKFMKQFRSMDTWVQYLLGACVLLLLISMFWPRHRHTTGVKLVPVPGSSYYQAVFEGFSSDDVEGALKSSDPVMVFYGQDWCGYCKKFDPVWKQFHQSYDKYRVVKVDCGKYPELGKKNKVSGYPTIKYHPNGLNDTTSVDYNGDRSLESLIAFANKQ